jgi:uncharacterized protein
LRYFDTSFLVPVLVAEPTSTAIASFFADHSLGDRAISHWVRVEVAAMLARDVRCGAISTRQSAELGSTFEALTSRSFMVLLPDRADFDFARLLVGNAQSALRGPDALHLAIAKNHGATVFYSLDKKLVSAARSLGLAVNSGFFHPGYSV